MLMQASERRSIRSKRLALLMQQRDIEATCEGCRFNRGGNTTNCAMSGCSKYKQLRVVGEELLNITSAKKAPQRRLLIDQAKRYGLTPRIYLALSSDHEWTDYFIRTAIGLTTKEMQAWKKAHGFVGNQRNRQACSNCEGSGTVQVDLFGTAEICMTCHGTGEVKA